jgi:O-antigen/teichoic acid export membrane protein
MMLNVFYLKTLTKINLKPDLKFLNENKKLKKEIILFSTVLIFSALSSLVIPKIDFFLVSKLQNDLGKVAIYSIGFYLATFIEIPKRTILQISLPIISGHLKKNEMTEMDALNKKNGTNQMVISTFLFLLIWLNIDNFYQIMPNGDYYSEGKWVFFIIGLSKVFESVNSTYSPIISNSSLYKWMPIIIVFNAGTSILFNYFFILKYGYIGGAISNIIAMFVLNILCLLLIQYKLRINPFSAKQIRIVLIFVLFLSLTFYGNWFSNPFIDGSVRSTLFAMAYVFFIFKSQASLEINQIIDKQMKRWLK